MKVISVIPTYKGKSSVARVALQAAQYCDLVIVVDDACPEASGAQVSGKSNKIIVVERYVNGGVGAATKTGVSKALELGADIIVKIDSDGQMDPALIPELIAPIEHKVVDFCKGTRFDSPEDLEGMPKIRLLGNAALSLVNKFSSGYWSVNDPTNGFIAFSSKIAANLSWDKIANDYFFESDLLFRTRLINGRIGQLRMKSVYGDEKSGLNPTRVLMPFMWKHSRNQLKRLVYMYIVREWNLGTIYMLSASFSLIIAIWSSLVAIGQSQMAGVGTGTAVLSSLGFILWVQFVTQFLTVDVASEPK